MKTTPLNDVSFIRTFFIITQSSLMALHRPATQVYSEPYPKWIARKPTVAAIAI
jgi:hypothetical protein